VSERQYWVGFNIVKGIGPARVRLLREAFGSLGEAWGASVADLEAAGLKGRPLQNLLETRKTLDLAAEMERLDKAGAAVLTWEDEDYPPRLHSIAQPPPVLYVRGSLDEVDDLALAIVGTRRASAYGRQVTQELAGQLARNGVTIVSGLARGIDGEAHRAALEAGGRTIAVLASGIDIIYPPEHRQLAHQITQQGALVSDYPLNTQPDAGNFPARNRIISGLAMGVLVTEAGIKSGALITADIALTKHNRDVFAVPGNVTAKGSDGTNKLIQEGAHVVMNVQDILEVMNLTSVIDYVEARETLPADATEAKLLAELDEGALHVDELGRRCELPIAQVTSTLTLMELKGMVRQVDTMTYARA
jgi:DNA processing protein